MSVKSDLMTSQANAKRGLLFKGSVRIMHECTEAYRKVHLELVTFSFRPSVRFVSGPISAVFWDFDICFSSIKSLFCISLSCFTYLDVQLDRLTGGFCARCSLSSEHIMN